MDYKRLLQEIDLRIEAAHRDVAYTNWDDTDPDYSVTMTLNEAVQIKKLIDIQTRCKDFDLQKELMKTVFHQARSNKMTFEEWYKFNYE